MHFSCSPSFVAILLSVSLIYTFPPRYMLLSYIYIIYMSYTYIRLIYILLYKLLLIMHLVLCMQISTFFSVLRSLVPESLNENEQCDSKETSENKSNISEKTMKLLKKSYFSASIEKTKKKIILLYANNWNTLNECKYITAYQNITESFLSSEFSITIDSYV